MKQPLTFEAFHVTVVEPPTNTRLGIAVIERVGVGTMTVTVALAGAEIPLKPVHVTEYVDVIDGLTETLPAVALLVENPPAAVQR